MTGKEWDIIRQRSTAQDDHLFCGRISEKIVCRPSCLVGNRAKNDLEAFHTLEDALAASYAPCPFCHPEIPGGGAARFALVQSARQYVEAHSAEKFSLSEMAGALYVNGSYLLRTFKAHTGCTLLWYHNRVRCDQVMALLERADLSISEAGEKAGFASSSHFTHVFKKMTGMTPSQYRERCRKQPLGT